MAGLLGKLAALSREPQTPSNAEDSLRRDSTADSDGTGSEAGNRGLSLLRRKMSRWKASKGATASGRGSMFKSIPEVAKMENTYKMEPDEGTKFMSGASRKAIEDVLSTYLGDLDYNPKVCARMCQKMSDEIKKRIKRLPYQRYKLVCHVIVGQKQDQSFEYASRCLWDDQKDNYATCTFQNKTIFAIATVFGVYFE